MVVVGMGLMWGSYTLMFWGWTMIKGYDISILDIAIPGHYKGAWPPAVTAPKGANPVGAQQPSGSGTTTPTPAKPYNPNPGECQFLFGSLHDACVKQFNA